MGLRNLNTFEDGASFSDWAGGALVFFSFSVSRWLCIGIHVSGRAALLGCARVF